MKLEPFQIYQMFLALRSHFTQESYDYIKYHAKVRASQESFLNNKDRFKYAKLAKQYDENQIQDFLIANFIAGKKWIGDMFDDDAHQNYVQYTKRKQSFTHHFSEQTHKLFKSVVTPRDVFSITGGQYPEILTWYLNGELSAETFAVLDSFIKFSDKFDEKIGKNDVIWSRARLLLKKLTPFVQYDRVKIKRVLREVIS